MQGTPNLNLIYEDDTVAAYIHDVNGEGTLMVFHADVIPTTDRAILEHYLDIIDEIDEGLREHGLEEIEAWVNTEEQIRYAQFFGFTEFLGELTVNGQKAFPPTYRLLKRL